MLLQFKGTKRLIETFLLNRYAHVDAVLGVNPASEDESQNPQQADDSGISGGRHRAKAPDKSICISCARGRKNSRCLMCECAEQRNCKQSMNGEKDGPERIDRDVVE